MESSTRAAAQTVTRLALRPQTLSTRAALLPFPSTYLRPQQRRDLSTTDARHASSRRQMNRYSAMVLEAMGPSDETKMITIKRKDVPDDIGMLPETIVRGYMLSYRHLFVEDPKLWLRLHWKLFTRSVQSTFALFWLLKWTRRQRFRFQKQSALLADQKSYPLQLSSRIVNALDAHVGFNTAMAGGDTVWLQRNACREAKREGISEIERRSGTARNDFEWRLEKYTGSLLGRTVPPWPLTALPVPGLYSYRVVSDVVTPLPMGKDILLRQCIVRVSSRQSLRRITDPKVITRDMTEYVVLQKYYFAGEEEDWYFWGTTQPTSIDTIRKMLDSKSTDETLRDKLRNLFVSNSSNV